MQNVHSSCTWNYSAITARRSCKYFTDYMPRALKFFQNFTENNVHINKKVSGNRMILEGHSNTTQETAKL